MNKALFDISDDILALEAILDEAGGEVTDEQVERTIDEWFAELGEERDSKLNGYGFLIRALEGRAAILKEEVSRLRARQQTAENKVARLKGRLEVFLKLHGLDKVETDAFTFALQKPGGKPKVGLDQRFLDAPEELPEGLRRVTFEPDLTAIREKLEAGDEEVAKLAWFEVGERRLRIR